MFRIGDKVTQLRNNYEKGAAGVFNGTVGVVAEMSLENSTMTVLTEEDESIEYGFDELDELTHAYAVTIHRSQGSEYPAVVIPLTMSSWLMLQRNLLYTGVTRAKKLVVLVGSRRALAIAVRTKGAAGATPPSTIASDPPPPSYSPPTSWAEWRRRVLPEWWESPTGIALGVGGDRGGRVPRGRGESFGGWCGLGGFQPCGSRWPRCGSSR